MLKRKKDIIKVLLKENPRFQLKSGTEKLKSSEKLFWGGAKEINQLERVSHALSENTLRYINSIVKPDTVTLETGGGYSTIIFGVNSKRHICVNPDRTSNQLIIDFLEKYGYSIESLEFIELSSDIALPALKDIDKIDIALIDGNHSFPFPIIDWYYIDKYLIPGSKILIDDSQINSIKILCGYLKVEPAYKYIRSIGRCMVFEKISEVITMGWAFQEINKLELRKIFEI